MSVAERTDLEAIVVGAKNDTKVSIVGKTGSELDPPPTGKIVIQLERSAGQIAETCDDGTQSLREVGVGVGVGGERAAKFGNVVLDMRGLGRDIQIRRRRESRRRERPRATAILRPSVPARPPRSTSCRAAVDHPRAPK